MVKNSIFFLLNHDAASLIYILSDCVCSLSLVNFVFLEATVVIGLGL